MARKLACLFYRLLKHGQQYVDKGTEYYEQRHREQQIRLLLKKAKQIWNTARHSRNQIVKAFPLS
jgi:transposase